jgi:hypothetical protein
MHKFADRQFQIQKLESRVLFSITAASDLTPAIRQSLLDNLNVSIKSTLQADLNTSNTAKFDQDLLNYMLAQNTNYFWQLSDRAGIASYITSNIGDGGTSTRADEILAHKFPAQSSSQDYTVQLPATIDWTKADATNTEFLHALNRQAYWNDLSQEYQYSGNGADVTEMVSELATWSHTYSTMALPSSWNASDQGAWLFDMGLRTQSWVWSYYQVLGATQWTKEANTLFLYKLEQQGEYMASAGNYGFADNRSLYLSQGWLSVADAFPEFKNSATWQTGARSLLFNSIDGQFFNDGSQDEQSPGYAGDLLGGILEAKQLDQLDGNGSDWTSAINTKVQNAVNSYYQFLTPDGKRPALGDTYRISAVTLFLKSDLVENLNLPAAKPRGRDVWLFGTAEVNPFIHNTNNPTLTNRGQTYSMTDSGNYIMRSGDDANARQVSFTIGPKGGNHGHFDDLSFELFGYGSPLIADPGPYQYDTSAQRAWAISTPAHNTVSIDGANESDMEGENNPGFSVDQYDVESDHVQITAHHFGYSYLAGGPVVSRSIWYDLDGTMLIVDWMNSGASHTAKTSFLLPGTNVSRDLTAGWMESTNSSGGNVKVQSLLQPGQTASFKQSGIFTSSNPPPNQSDPATQFFITQTGSFVAFATLVTAYNGTTPPNISATLDSAITSGHGVGITLTKNGVSQDIAFNPPQIAIQGDATTNGQYTDIKYDAKGNLHMAYYDDVAKDLKYAVRDTHGNWSPIQTIDNTLEAGVDASMAIAPNGTIGIAYSDSHVGDLKYAQFDGTNWTIQTVDTKGSTGHYPSLAFSRNNGAAITYYDLSHGDLRMAVSANTASGWILSTIDSGSVGTKDVGRYSDLQLDPSRSTASKWAISYDDDSAGKIMYAVQGSIGGGVQKNGYTFFTISDVTQAGGYTSLAFDSQNRPAISFYDAGITGLRFSQSSGSTTAGPILFATTIVNQTGTLGAYTDLSFDANGAATIFYFDKTHNRVLRSVFSNKKWTTTAMSAGGREIHVARFGKTLAYTDLDITVPTLKVLFA